MLAREYLGVGVVVLLLCSASGKKKVSPPPSNTHTLLKMADHAAGEDIFVYTGGRAPQHVVNAIVDESVDEIDDGAFGDNPNLRSVVCHDRVLKVGQWAFFNCSSLERVKMPGVKVIGECAFYNCNRLVYIELDKLEMVGERALIGCTSLQRVKLPKRPLDNVHLLIQV